jgi:hypothetical protein
MIRSLITNISLLFSILVVIVSKFDFGRLAAELFDWEITSRSHTVDAWLRRAVLVDYS